MRPNRHFGVGTALVAVPVTIFGLLPTPSASAGTAATPSAAVGVSGPGGGGTTPSLVMTFSQVAADGNYVNPSCTATNPPGLSGHEKLHQPAYDHAYDWSLPNTIADGTSATVHVSVTSKHNGSESAQIAFKPPSEFGSSEGLFAVQVIADPNSSKADGKTTTFHPTRAFTREKLYIRLETGCAAWIYEYVGG
ncbi:MAG TPA: hypothetical protein VGD71_36465 [Kribbella sp.]|jgi:hypothetical protein